jgi:hypothetical protein
MGETGPVPAAKFGAIFPHLDERQRRLLMGAEARALGHGGIRWPGPPGSARPRCRWGSMSWTLAPGRWAEHAGRAGDASGRRSWIRGCGGAAGPGRATGAGRSDVAAAVDDEVDPQPGSGADPPGAPGRRQTPWATCCGRRDSACRATPRPSRASGTRTGTRSSGTSASRSKATRTGRVESSV